MQDIRAASKPGSPEACCAHDQPKDIRDQDENAQHSSSRDELAPFSPPQALRHVPAPPRKSTDVRIFMCGDVMLGRGIDQVLSHPSHHIIHEDLCHSALDYVALAEERNGTIEKPLSPLTMWGAAIREIEKMRPDVRIINLETSITTSSIYEPKGINYRMHPDNIGSLAPIGPDVICLANNHVLDFGEQGLIETLNVLHRNNFATAGAGAMNSEACRPAVIHLNEMESGGKGKTSSGLRKAEWEGMAIEYHEEGSKSGDGEREKRSWTDQGEDRIGGCQIGITVPVGGLSEGKLKHKGQSKNLSALRRSDLDPYSGSMQAELKAPREGAESLAPRILVFACCERGSGVPEEWSAGPRKPGVWIISLGRPRSQLALIETIRGYHQENDIIIVSIHWGSNWGYHVHDSYRQFAHNLIDSGLVSIVHGHSSHHPRPIEIYCGRLILHGCGDFINNYEGIQNPFYEMYRDDLPVMYFADIDRKSGHLRGLLLVPLKISQFRLHEASTTEGQWVASTLERESKAFGVKAINFCAHKNIFLVEW